MTPLERAILDAAEAWAASTGPESVYETQTTVPVKLGGGWGPGPTCMGTMWLCPRCLKEHQERHAAAPPAPKAPVASPAAPGGLEGSADGGGDHLLQSPRARKSRKSV